MFDFMVHGAFSVWCGVGSWGIGFNNKWIDRRADKWVLMA